MSPRAQELVGLLLGAIAMGSLLLAFHEPEYSPLPFPKGLTIIAGLLVGGCLGLIAPTLGRAILATFGMAVLAGGIQVAIQFVGAWSGPYQGAYESLVTVFIQRAAIGVAIVVPAGFIGAFVTSIID